MSRFRIVSTTALAALVMTGCASGTGGASSATGGSRNVITRAQLDEIEVSDVHQAVQRLRSSWLRQRLPNAPILVYMDGVRAGQVEFLRTIAVERVDRLLFISASDATTRWGTGHGSGVIEVITRRS